MSTDNASLRFARAPPPVIRSAGRLRLETRRRLPPTSGRFPTMTRAVVLANGVPPTAEALRQELASSSLFVCADGGANAARSHGLRPSAIVGDFDSATAETLAHFKDVEHVRDGDTERTDTEKAIDYVLSHGTFEQG